MASERGPAGKDYHLMDDEEMSDAKTPFLTPVHRLRERHAFFPKIILIALVLSLFTNCVLVLRRTSYQRCDLRSAKTAFGGTTSCD